MLFIMKFIKLKPIIKFKKFELYNYVTDAAWSGGLCVSLVTPMSSAKTDEPIEMLFGMCTPRNQGTMC